MSDVILSCKCGDTPKFAQESFAMLFPSSPAPEIIVGNRAILAFADRLRPQTEAERFVRAIGGSKEKMAIYLEWEKESGDVNMAYNLLTGNQIQ